MTFLKNRRKHRSPFHQGLICHSRHHQSKQYYCPNAGKTKPQNLPKFSKYTFLSSSFFFSFSPKNFPFFPFCPSVRSLNSPLPSSFSGVNFLQIQGHFRYNSIKSPENSFGNGRNYWGMRGNSPLG